MLVSMYNFKLSSIAKDKEGGNMDKLFTGVRNILDGTLCSFLANSLSS